VSKPPHAQSATSLPIPTNPTSPMASTAPSGRPVMQRLVSGETTHGIIAQCQTLITDMLHRLPPPNAAAVAAAVATSPTAAAAATRPTGGVIHLNIGNGKSSSSSSASGAVHPVGGMTSEDISTRLTSIQGLLRKAEVDIIIFHPLIRVSIH
jgi:hypothetical protein